MMKSLFYKLVFVLIALLGWVGYDQWQKHGDRLLEAADTLEEKATALKSSLITEGAGETPRSRSVTYYRWRDASGTLQLTDTPPPEGTPYTESRVSTERNLIQGERPTTAAAPESAKDRSPVTDTVPIPGLPSPAQAQKALQQTREVAAQLEERQRRLQAIQGD